MKETTCLGSLLNHTQITLKSHMVQLMHDSKKNLLNVSFYVVEKNKTKGFYTTANYFVLFISQEHV